MSVLPIKNLKTAALAAVVAFGGLATSPVLAQTVLRMNNWLPPGHNQMELVMKPWAASVEEATQGRVVVKFTDASLGAPPRQYDLAIDGIADVVYGIIGYTPGRFPLMEIAEVPFISGDSEAMSVALWDVYNKYFKEFGEFRDVELMGIYVQGSTLPMTTEKAGPVTDLDSWAGKKFRVGGGVVTEINSTLGGTNVSAPANQVYEMLSNGVADGTLLPQEAYQSFNLKGTIGHLTKMPGGFSSTAWFIVANKASFAKISEEDQAAIHAISGLALAHLGGRVFAETNEIGEAAMVADGVQVHVMSDETIAVVKEKTSFLNERWLEKVAEKGLDGQAILDEFRSESARISAGM